MTKSELKLSVCVTIAQGKLLSSSLAHSSSFSLTIEGEDLELKKEIFSWIEAYLTKTNFPFSFFPKLERSVSSFDAKVLRELEKISFGKTISYKELGKRVGTKGFRAVGSACGRNPLPLFIPCHRIVREDGKVGGFTCGTAIKEELLQFEAD